MSYAEIANLITILPVPSYIESQSDPEHEKYVFSYQITIENTSNQSVQLLSRRWLITDANGEKVTVQGEGVVGQKPHIAPGEAYQYASGAVIKTPVGTMEGFYQLVTEDGTEFDVAIPVFSLTVPNIIH